MIANEINRFIFICLLLSLMSSYFLQSYYTPFYPCFHLPGWLLPLAPLLYHTLKNLQGKTKKIPPFSKNCASCPIPHTERRPGDMPQAGTLYVHAVILPAGRARCCARPAAQAAASARYSPGFPSAGAPPGRRCVPARPPGAPQWSGPPVRPRTSRQSR